MPARNVHRTTTLNVTLRHPGDQLSVTLDRAAIIEQNKLLAQIQRIRTYNRTHVRSHTHALHIGYVITDTTRHTHNSP